MTKERTIVLGAGLAGLSAAFHLQRLNIDCQVFEKEESVGGLCRSRHIQGFTFDCAGHLLHFKNNYTLDLLKKLTGGNLMRHKRDSWIYSLNIYTRYPFQANLFGFPLRLKIECILGLIKVKALNWFNHKIIKRVDKFKNLDNGITFKDWVFNTFGSGIARHFMLPYNAKFWTVEPSELACGWIDGHIHIPTLGQAIAGAFIENKRRFGYNSSLWYPIKGGIEEIPRAFSKQIKRINTSCEAVKIDIQKKEIKFKDGRRENFDKLISTMPLPELLNLVDNLPEGIVSSLKRLRYVSIFNLNLGIDRDDLSNKHWVYFPESSYIFHRVGFSYNLSPDLVPSGKSSLSVEVSYSENRPLDKKGIVQRIIQELRQAKILSENDKIVVQDINEIKYGYILYDHNHQNCTQAVLGFLAENKIYSIGRYGSWRYMSMEDALLDGKNSAERLYQ